MKNSPLVWQEKFLMPAALLLSIPAFYLILAGWEPLYRNIGSVLYLLVAAMAGADLLSRNKTRNWRDSATMLDWAIFLGAIFSIWPSNPPWSMLEWVLRMVYCAIVFSRLVMFSAKFVLSCRLLHVVAFAVAVLAVAGAVFLWLEPRVHTYADGVWLAFITGATVGYGDLVPSTPASRIFAAFIVLLGYALFSVVTANISAMLVGEDEKRLEHELHADMRMLRKEISLLHKELNSSLVDSRGDDPKNADNQVERV
ncbi:ion channel family protein [Collimonas arenae]|uniref:Ion channel family protein n=1 Tax=Collimonas arenae TaxID=279058 RepID=A0A127QJ00_9BURK|nr:potassium channel family protein [Collimonas arenae]AMP00109.1 ion channel family protein [Collimonas arenae]AMP10007.1 ion channel family protein [Collimonas arenae]